MHASFFSVFILFNIIVIDKSFWQWHYVHIYLCCVLNSQTTMTRMQLKVFFISQDVMKFEKKNVKHNGTRPRNFYNYFIRYLMNTLSKVSFPKFHFFKFHVSLICPPTLEVLPIFSNILSLKFLRKVQDN